MGSVETKLDLCKNCGAPLAQWNRPDEPRPACPICGCDERILREALSDVISVSDDVDVRVIPYAELLEEHPGWSVTTNILLTSSLGVGLMNVTAQSPWLTGTGAILLAVSYGVNEKRVESAAENDR